MIEPILIAMSKPVYVRRGKLKRGFGSHPLFAQADAQQKETQRPIREKPAPQD